MPRRFVTVGALIGSTLIALSLVGSSRNQANVPIRPNPAALAESSEFHVQGKTALAEGRYEDARDAYRSAAIAAARAGNTRNAAMDWSNAGYTSILTMEFKPALEDLMRAKEIAQAHGQMQPLLYSESNLASLYLQMGDPESALHIAQEGLNGPASHADARMHAMLLQQEGQSLAMQHRLPEAEPLYRDAIEGLMDTGELDDAARAWAALGEYYTEAGRYDDAERALSESLRLVRTHRLKAAANVLVQLARLRALQGDRAKAEYLFQDAIDAHETVTPLWLIYYERGATRLQAGENRAALEDFRQSRRLAVRMRANIVPADQDRVAVENRVSRIFQGLVNAGNRLALETRNESILEETFNAAEQDRLWSLRALLPEQNDWRSHLPERYWGLLARYQAAERSQTPAPPEVQLELRQAEAQAGAESDATTESSRQTPLQHAREALPPDSTILSFIIGDSGSWLWLVDRQEIHVYGLPGREQIERQVSDFNRALQNGEDSSASGARLFQTLFGRVPAAVLKRDRWLIEPDGPLYQVPFAALPTNNGFLIEHTAIQTIPGALLMERGAIHRDASFTGIGDPIFNEADQRYRGAHTVTAVALPRLPNTATELKECSLAWGADTHLLTGSGVGIQAVDSAISQTPAILHFATHVIDTPNRFGSGFIALGLDAQGTMELMGPHDIAAHRVPGSLVMMNGCHSAQGVALEGSGLMGLTRAWIGAGASAVIAAQWDVPDDVSQSLMVNFYRALKDTADGNPAMALRAAQLAAIRSGGPNGQPSKWAGYFLLSRI